MAEFFRKYMCPCLAVIQVQARRSARCKVRALVRTRHRIHEGLTSTTSGIEDSMISRRDSLAAVYSISGKQQEDSTTIDAVASRRRRHSPSHPSDSAAPPPLRERTVDLPGTVSVSGESADGRMAAASVPKYNMADGTQELSVDALMRLPQPSRSYITTVRTRRLMKELKAISKIIAESEERDAAEELENDRLKTLDTSSDCDDATCQVIDSDSGKADKAAEGSASEATEDSCQRSQEPEEAGCSTSTEDKCECGAKDETEKEREKRISHAKGAAAINEALADGGFMTRARLRGPPYAVELVNDDLAEWNIKLFHVDPASALARDMRRHKIDHVLFNMTFPDNFPFAPPFVRVVSPHIEYGYVLDGGAICMELLTPQGWSSSYTIDAVITQLGATLVAGDGRVVPVGVRSDVLFNKLEAQLSFRAIVETHERYGWHKAPGDNS